MKIVAIPYTHTLSHISRPLLIAKELRKRGHDIIFAGESSKIKLIQAEGFPVLPLHEPDPVTLFKNIREGRLRFVSDSEVERMIEADLALIRETQPDLALTDGRFSAPISTQLAGIRHVAVVNASSTEYRAIPYIPFFEWIPSWLIGRDPLARRILDLLNIRLEIAVFNNIARVFKEIGKRYRLNRAVTATNCLTGNDITLLPDIPEYFPTRNLPSNYYYIGPLTWKSVLRPPSWWPPKKDGKPLIYVTMGTTGVGDFFQKVYELFRNSDITCIITTGAQVKDMSTIDEKVYIEAFIDGDLVMENCNLVVCHGGNGTIYQALQHGKPVIGIPTIPDQKFNMRRVGSLGIGKMLPWKEFATNPQSLYKLIWRVIEDESLQLNAIKYKNILSTYNAPQIAADVIEKSLM